MNSFKKKIKENNLTIKEVAEIIGINNSSLCAYLSNPPSDSNKSRHATRMPKKVFEDLCTLLDISFEDGLEYYKELYPDLKFSTRNGDNMKKLGIRIYDCASPWHKLRASRGLTVCEIAEYLGVSQGTVSRAFNGRETRNVFFPKHLKKLCELFDISIEEGRELAKQTKNLYISGNINGRKSTYIMSANEDISEEENPMNMNFDVTGPVDFSEEEKKMHDSIMHPERVVEEPVEKIEPTPDDILKGSSRVGIIDYVLDCIYGKISRDDYTRIENILHRYFL